MSGTHPTSRMTHGKGTKAMQAPTAGPHRSSGALAMQQRSPTGINPPSRPPGAPQRGIPEAPLQVFKIPSVPQGHSLVRLQSAALRIVSHALYLPSVPPIGYPPRDISAALRSLSPNGHSPGTPCPRGQGDVGGADTGMCPAALMQRSAVKKAV